MKVAIAGAGMSGAYLYRLLDEEGIQADVYDVKRRNPCGLHSCAWGATPTSEVRKLVSRFLEPTAYELQRFDSINIEGLDIPADLLTIDKPRLINDLLCDTEVHTQPFDPNDYDRIVDATGEARAFLGPTSGPQFLAPCRQYRIKLDEDLGMSIKISSLGYEWCFPIGNNEYHMGFGNLKTDTTEFRPSTTGVMERGKILCRCNSKVRLSSPHATQPFVSGNIVGVGESIGAVAPLAADGIVYAMQTAEMLVDHWDNLEQYPTDILKRYDWMGKERQGLNRLFAGKMPSIRELRAFLHHTRIAGLSLSLKQAMFFFRRILDSQTEAEKSLG